jgi:hypothetical protein
MCEKCVSIKCIKQNNCKTITKSLWILDKPLVINFSEVSKHWSFYSYNIILYNLYLKNNQKIKIFFIKQKNVWNKTKKFYLNLNHFYINICQMNSKIINIFDLLF